MKKLFFGAVMMLLMASCSGNGALKKAKEDSARIADSIAQVENAKAAAEQARLDSIRQDSINEAMKKAELETSVSTFITDLYAVVFNKNFYDITTEYFTPEFVSLYKRTRKIESQRMAESDSDGGMDEEFFDDEFWSSYNDDPKSMGAKAKIKKISLNKNNNGQNTATVIVNVIPPGNENPIRIDLVQTEKGWKISDYREYKKPMQRYIKS